MRKYDYHSNHRLYRSRDGWICGVCQGLSDYFNLRVGWVRFIAILIFLFSGFWPIVIIYIVACLLMKPEPVIPLENESQRDFYDNYVSSRSRTLRDLTRRFSSLDRRLRRMEDRVTSRDFEWEQRLNS
jgi:phage shock protein C